jgi:hypothetical protein
MNLRQPGFFNDQPLKERRKKMRMRLIKSFVILFALYLLSLVVGCATTPKTIHPEFETRSRDIKTAGLISPDIKIYELTAGGLRELKDDWCAKGKENVQKAMIECLREKPLEIRPITMDREMEEEMEEIYALYRAVSSSIIMHTVNIQGGNIFPEKVKTFDYSIGSMEKILKKYGGDGLIFVTGFDEISSAGRQTLKAVGIIAGIALAASGVGGAMIIPRSGVTLVSVALVDSSGVILWYNIKGSEGGYDLRNPESATKLVRDILADYPGGAK